MTKITEQLLEKRMKFRQHASDPKHSSGQVALGTDLTHAPGQHVVYRCPADTENFRRSGFVAFDQVEDILQVARLNFFHRHEGRGFVW